MSNLIQAWTTTSAALPNGWRIVGVPHADLYPELAKLPAHLELAATVPNDGVSHPAVARLHLTYAVRRGMDQQIVLSL